MFSVRVFTVLLLFGILSEGIGTVICGSYDLSVTDVTSTSAVLHWKIGNKARKRSRDHEVLCAGLSHYTKADGTPVTDTDKVNRFAPRRLERHFLGNLLPNFRYSCIVVEAADKSSLSDSDMSRPLLFTTHYKAPETPKAPLIHTDNADGNYDHDLQVDLFAASSKYGPISGYKVQFHLVDGSPSYIDGLPRVLPEFLKPFGPLAPLEKVQKTPQPISFYISYDTLPENITVGDDLLGGALKNGAVYTVVTVAYTRMADNSENILFSASKPSQPFTAKDHVSHHQAKRVGGRHTSRNLAFILGVVLPLVIVVYISLVGAFIAHREFQMAKHRKSSKRNKMHPKKPSPSTGLTNGVPLDVIIPHAFDIEHSHSHLGHHDHLERTEKGRPLGAPVLPRHPTTVSPTSSLSLMHPTISDTCAVDIDGLSEQNDWDFPSLPQLMVSESSSKPASMPSQVMSFPNLHVDCGPAVPRRSATYTEIADCVDKQNERNKWDSHFSPPFIISESISTQASEASMQSQVSTTSVACSSTVPPRVDVPCTKMADNTEDLQRIVYNPAHELLWSTSDFDSSSSSSSEDEDDPVNTKMLMGHSICIFDRDRTSFNNVRAYYRNEEDAAQREGIREEGDLEHLTAHLQEPIECQSSRRLSFNTETQTGSKNLQGMSDDEESVGSGEEQVGDKRSSVDVNKPAGEGVQSQKSSHVFLPRGFSNGPYVYRTQSLRTRSSHAHGLSSGSSYQLFSHRSSIRNLRAQLSIGSSLGYQTDQVPELELDWYFPDSA